MARSVKKQKVSILAGASVVRPEAYSWALTDKARCKPLAGPPKHLQAMKEQPRIMKDQSRRSFVKSSVVAGLGVSLPAAGMAAAAPKELFVHHVLFYLKNKGSEADKTKLLEGLNKLAKVPTIKMVHIGTPAATTRDVIERSYTYSWLCFFDSPADEEVYQKHPIHDDFRNNYSSLWEKVVIYDAIGPKR